MPCAGHAGKKGQDPGAGTDVQDGVAGAHRLHDGTHVPEAALLVNEHGAVEVEGLKWRLVVHELVPYFCSNTTVIAS